ncbi:M20 family peptidase [Shewanella gaetbuli]|uniref:M20 family peptidase n=1 Tax=Shewanella gaetbuli TaxID=220752 RepID=A0A9X1ZUB8_9GAMM|nr:M20 family peptidase [Shewanella gaetbuli]MCL1142401.1 M20 family peptidase [Shewanella gaetbuli]
MSFSKKLTLFPLLFSASIMAQQGEFTSMQMKDVALNRVKVDVEGAANRLAKGIQFATISNEDRNDFNEAAFTGYHQFLADSYPKVHKTLQKELVGKERQFSLLYTWQGTNPELAPVVLMAHQDVVPIVPETKHQWQHDPFGGVIADGYIWGRGAIDDKSMIHAILEAAEMKIAAGFVPERTLIFAFGHDEEVGGEDGIKHLVDVLEQQKGYQKIALVLDEAAPMAPGLFPGIAQNTALISVAEKGYVSLSLTVSGAGGHSSMPPASSNIGILAKAINQLETNPFPYRITSTLRDQYRYLGPELPESTHDMYSAVAYGSDDKLTPLEQKFIEGMSAHPLTQAMLRTTTAVTMINGGIKANVLPTTATAVVNFRILQGDTIESVIETVHAVVNDERVTVADVSQSINPSAISPVGSKEYNLIEHTIRQTWGNDLIVTPFLAVGGTDAKHFAAKSFAPNVYRYTPLQLESGKDIARFHGINERILAKELAGSISFFYTFMDNVQSL